VSVSIIIPTCNRVQLLRNLLESIAKQSYQDFEVIVVDDVTSEKESLLALISQYEKIFPLTLLENLKSSGAPYSRNRGIKIARYDLIALVDDDDEWFPKKIQKQVELFSQSAPDVGIVYTWTQVINENKELLREQNDLIEGKALSEILTSCFIPSPSVMLRKEALFKAGLFDESLPSCQDWDMWTRVLFSGYSCKVCPEYLTYYRKHSGATIGNSPKAKEGFRLYYKKHFFKLLCFGKLRHLFRFFRLSFNI